MVIKVFSGVAACWVRQVQMAHTHVHVATASSTPRESHRSQICPTSRRPPLLARAEVLSHLAGGQMGTSEAKELEGSYRSDTTGGDQREDTGHLSTPTDTPVLASERGSLDKHSSSLSYSNTPRLVML